MELSGLSMMTLQYYISLYIAMSEVNFILVAHSVALSPVVKD